MSDNPYKVNDAEKGNLYNFLKGQAEVNDSVRAYLDALGLFDEDNFTHVVYLKSQDFILKYILLNASEKVTMRNNFLGTIKKITKNPGFTFPENFSGNRKYIKHRKSRKVRNSRKGRKSRKYRSL